MKKASDDLYRLIKSMTRSEKGYFKKFAFRSIPGGKSNYITLFDAVDSMAEYDEEELRKKLRNQPFVNQVPVYKVYLFNLILKALNLYGSYENAETKLAELLANVKILEKKGLHKEALKLLKKAKEIAYKYDKEKYIIEILFTERNIIMSMPDKKVYERRKQIHDENLELVERLKRRIYYNWLSDRMVIFVEQKGDFMETDRQAEIEKIISDPYLSSEGKATGYIEKNYFYHTHLFYHLSRDDYMKVHEYLQKEINHFEQYPHMIDEIPKNYVSALITFLLFSNMIKKREDVKKTIAKLGALRRHFKGKLSPDLETYLYMHAANTELMIYTQNCEMEKGRLLAGRIDGYLKKYRKDMNPSLSISMLYNTAYFHFVDGNYDESLRFLNNLLNDTETDLRSDAYYFARVFSLFVHFELGNFDYLEYEVESTYRFLKKRKGLKNVEKILIGFLKRALGLSSEKELKSECKELLSSLKRASKDRRNRFAFLFFDSMSWAESKITGEKFHEVLKRKREA